MKSREILHSGQDGLMFDNVNKKDKVILTISSPARLAKSFVDFNQLYVLPTMKHVKGWWSIGFVYAGVANNSTVTMKDGSKVTFGKNNVNELISKMRSLDISEETRKKFRIKINGDKAILHAGGRKLTVGLESLHPVVNEFNGNQHKNMDVRGKTVVDIGAYLGETALYYATSGGAKKVYAYELFPFISKKAQENVRMSSMSDKITILNEGVGGRPDSIMVSSGESSFANTNAKHHRDKVKIRIVSLDQIVKKLKIRDGALKVDCEGYEYEIFRHASSKAIRAFTVIHIEYHYGYMDLVERLEKEGFRVKRTAPVMNVKGLSRPMLNGDLLAIRHETQKVATSD